MYLSFLVLSDIFPFMLFSVLPLHSFTLFFPLVGFLYVVNILKLRQDLLLTVCWTHPFYIFRRLSALRFLYLTSFCVPLFLRNKGFLLLWKTYRLYYVFYHFYFFSVVFPFWRIFRFCFYSSDIRYSTASLAFHSAVEYAKTGLWEPSGITM